MKKLFNFFVAIGKNAWVFFLGFAIGITPSIIFIISKILPPIISVLSVVFKK